MKGTTTPAMINEVLPITEDQREAALRVVRRACPVDGALIADILGLE